ncbi:MAG: hypothetical protein ACEQSD_04180 [Flavobacteriales bacterium]
MSNTLYGQATDESAWYTSFSSTAMLECMDGSASIYYALDRRIAWFMYAEYARMQRLFRSMTA